MEELAADAKYTGKVNFLLVNCTSAAEAQKYASMKNLSACPHGAGDGAAYGVRTIPHKVLIGKDGKVVKNGTGFEWSDIDAAM